MKTSACSILDFKPQRSRPFAFPLLLLQSQYPDLLLLFNHFKDVVVIWRLDFSQIDKIGIGVSYSYLSICKANRICKTNYSFIIIPTFSIRVSIRAFSLIRSSSNSVSYY